jgi:hypothetical protein
VAILLILGFGASNSLAGPSMRAFSDSQVVDIKQSVRAAFATPEALCTSVTQGFLVYQYGMGGERGIRKCQRHSNPTSVRVAKLKVERQPTQNDRASVDLETAKGRSATLRLANRGARWLIASIRIVGD